jgi:hypothetical protein
MRSNCAKVGDIVEVATSVQAKMPGVMKIWKLSAMGTEGRHSQLNATVELGWKMLKRIERGECTLETPACLEDKDAETRMAGFGFSAAAWWCPGPLLERSVMTISVLFSNVMYDVAQKSGESRLFDITLIGKVGVTGFNTAAVARFEEGKVYYVSKARVNLSKKKYSNLTNDYDLSFDRNFMRSGTFVFYG